MRVETGRRTPVQTVVGILLIVLATPMAIPTANKLLGNNAGFLRNLGFISGPRATPLAWGLALAVAAAYIAFAVWNVPPVSRTWLELSWLKLIAFSAAIAAATVEEALFRRWVMDYVMEQGGGLLLQVGVSAFTFGLAHSIFGLIKRSPAAALRAVLITGILGGLLALVYGIGNRSLAPCITAHLLVTFALEPWLLLAAVTGEWRFEADEV